jgi:pilus assembly protein CpaB
MQSRVLAVLIAVVLALVATAALVVYVNGADRRAISDQSPRMVWVAATPIPAGTSGLKAINTKMVKQAAVPSKTIVPGAVLSVTQIQNRYAAVDLEVGEQLLQKRWVGAEDVAGGRLLPIQSGYQALSIGMDAVRQVAGFVTPGDRVSLVLTMKLSGPGGELERSRFLLQDIQVLAVGSTALANAAAQGGGGRVNQGKGQVAAVTLSIPQDRVERVVYAAEHGSIYMTLLARGAKPLSNTDGATADNVIPG